MVCYVMIHGTETYHDGHCLVGDWLIADLEGELRDRFRALALQHVAVTADKRLQPLHVITAPACRRHERR